MASKESSDSASTSQSRHEPESEATEHEGSEASQKNTDRKQGKKNTKYTEGPNQRQHELDLTNPEDLLQKLESIDLTEAETEELLEEAYKINRRLKRQLEKRNVPAPMSRSQTLGALSYSSHMNRGNPLPPLGNPRVTGVYGVRLTRRSMPMSGSYRSPVAQSHSNHSDFTPNSINRKSPTPMTRSAAASPPRSRSRQKPTWNERFSYS